MNTYNVNDNDFLNSSLYKEFINKNPSNGYLRIRAYSANEALPVQGLKVIISTEFNGNNIIFFEGETNNSGLIDRISLPAPKSITNNLDVPDKTTYEILATYPEENLNTVYSVNMYEGICVVQNINVAPKALEAGVFRWQ